MRQICAIYFKFIIGLLVFFTMNACQSPSLSQRYKQLNKIAVTAKSESDTIRKHIEKYYHDVSSQQNITQVPNTDSASVSDATQIKFSEKSSAFSAIKNVVKEESMRLATKYPTVHSDFRSDGKMAARDTKIWWLWGVLLFIGAFMLAVALIRWISESGSGCLVIGSWILFSVLLAFLLIKLLIN